MKKMIIVKYGEISLKGLNRKYFIDLLAKNIRLSLRKFENIKVHTIQSRIIVSGYKEENEEDIINRLKKVFGIVYLTKCYEVEKDMDKIKETALKIMKENDYKTFKVETKRSDKKYPLKSPEISKDVGAYVLINTEHLKVDVKNPDAVLKVEIRENAYVYAGDIKCNAGLPVNSSGVGGLLLSGGLDSPVAGYLMNKRGMKIVGLHFHSYPFTSMDAKEKVKDLAEVLSDYNMGITLVNISLTKIQEAIIQNCEGEYLTVILRRFMIKISNMLKDKFGLKALITGESLGQVASQTIEGISCTNACSSLPILRPLIAFDKTEIVDISRKIGAYDISIRPYEDCCTIFVPKHPIIKPKLSRVLEEEAKLDIDELVEEAVNNIEILKL
ncbi:tRNA uracil 4-sulfurtransferase ThiI [Anaerofustis sp.]|uniref:tRNA uracil 4-sulfurtransferase ThiI n=1 Tax=Anaerofustis sp. TaxID=1872517 RepID=UPI0025C44FFF|nr:tRNA uracil 4-sulfurtransferase ThiI [Anaerofustis sp.]